MAVPGSITSYYFSSSQISSSTSVMNSDPWFSDASTTTTLSANASSMSPISSEGATLSGLNYYLNSCTSWHIIVDNSSLEQNIFVISLTFWPSLFMFWSNIRITTLKFLYCLEDKK